MGLDRVLRSSAVQLRHTGVRCDVHRECNTTTVTNKTNNVYYAATVSRSTRRHRRDRGEPLRRSPSRSMIVGNLVGLLPNPDPGATRFSIPLCRALALGVGHRSGSRLVRVSQSLYFPAPDSYLTQSQSRRGILFVSTNRQLYTKVHGGRSVAPIVRFSHCKRLYLLCCTNAAQGVLSRTHNPNWE